MGLKKLTFEKLSEFAILIYKLDSGHCFWGFIYGTLNATCLSIMYQ